eukprot:m51a1_g3623 putative leucine rich repeat protein (2312) ;mRNA; f:97992-117214
MEEATEALSALLSMQFQAYDPRGRGLITLDDFLALELGEGCQPGDEKYLRDLFRQLDTDGDGVVNFAEFSDGMTETIRTKMRDVFESCDEGDGLLDAEELAEALGALGHDGSLAPLLIADLAGGQRGLDPVAFLRAYVRLELHGDEYSSRLRSPASDGHLSASPLSLASPMPPRGAKRLSLSLNPALPSAVNLPSVVGPAQCVSREIHASAGHARKSSSFLSTLNAGANAAVSSAAGERARARRAAEEALRAEFERQNFTAAQVAALRRLFESYDTRCKGALGVEEIRVAMKGVDPRLLLQQLDRNRSGLVEFEEFALAARELDESGIISIAAADLRQQPLATRTAEEARLDARVRALERELHEARAANAILSREKTDLERIAAQALQGSGSGPVARDEMRAARLLDEASPLIRRKSRSLGKNCSLHCGRLYARGAWCAALTVVVFVLVYGDGDILGDLYSPERAECTALLHADDCPSLDTAPDPIAASLVPGAAHPSGTGQEETTPAEDLETEKFRELVRCLECAVRLKEMRCSNAACARRAGLAALTKWFDSTESCIGLCSCRMFCADHGKPHSACFSEQPDVKHTCLLYIGMWNLARGVSSKRHLVQTSDGAEVAVEVPEPATKQPRKAEGAPAISHMRTPQGQISEASCAKEQGLVRVDVAELLAKQPSLTFLDLSCNSLVDVPREIERLTAMTTLRLFSNHLAAVPPALFNCTSLTLLDLSKNGLQTLPPAIAGLASLRELDVSWNRLSLLPAELGRLSGLRVLALNINRLGGLPDSLAALQALETLDLSNNDLAGLPAAVLALRSLASLNASANAIAELPDALAQLRSLTRLDLRSNRLRCLPESAGSLASLALLHLGHNALEALPASLGSLSALRELHVSENRLRALPASLGALSSLRRLSLWNNRLEALPPELAALAALVEVDAGRNALGALVPLPPSMDALRIVRLSANALDRWPAALPPGVNELFLAENRLAAVPEGALARLPELRTLVVTRNALAELPGDAPRELRTLEAAFNLVQRVPDELGALAQLGTLNLGANVLAEVPAALGALRQLRVLVLGYNRLQTLPAALAGLAALQVLDLAGNALVRVPLVVAAMPSLRTLLLSNNSLGAFPGEVAAALAGSLETLDLSCNYVADAAPLCAATSLQVLSLAHNQLQRLPRELAALEQLADLDVSDNRIAELPAELEGLRRLRQLVLSHNDLRLAAPDSPASPAPPPPAPDQAAAAEPEACAAAAEERARSPSPAPNGAVVMPHSRSPSPGAPSPCSARRSTVEEAVKAWVSAVVGDAQTFGRGVVSALKSGVVLCRVANALWPGSVARVQTGNVPWMFAENVASFLAAASASLGVRKEALFAPADLLEERNPGLVVSALHAVALAAARRADYKGPAVRDVASAVAGKERAGSGVPSPSGALRQSSSFSDKSDPASASAGGGRTTQDETDLLEWINATLAETKAEIRVRNLASDIRNSVKLFHFVQALTGSVAPPFHKNPTDLWSSTQNATRLLAFIGEHVVAHTAVCCSADDIVHGNTPKVVELLRTLREMFDLDYIFLKQLGELDDDKARTPEPPADEKVEAVVAAAAAAAGAAIRVPAPAEAGRGEAGSDQSSFVPFSASASVEGSPLATPVESEREEKDDSASSCPASPSDERRAHRKKKHRSLTLFEVPAAAAPAAGSAAAAGGAQTPPGEKDSSSESSESPSIKKSSSGGLEGGAGDDEQGGVTKPRALSSSAELDKSETGSAPVSPSGKSAASPAAASASAKSPSSSRRKAPRLWAPQPILAGHATAPFDTWPDADIMLLDRTLRDDFRMFIEREMATETLQFLEDVSKWKTANVSASVNRDEQRAAAVELFTRYCREGSEREINISGDTKLKLKARLEQAQPLDTGIWDVAAQEVRKMIRTDLYPRWIAWKEQGVAAEASAGGVPKPATPGATSHKALKNKLMPGKKEKEEKKEEKVEKAQASAKEKLLKSLVESERKYIEMMECICRDLIMPVYEKRILTGEEIWLAFGNLPCLLFHHKKFLVVLEERIKDWDNSKAISDVLIDGCSFMLLYSLYIKGYPRAPVYFRFLQRKYPSFLEAVAKFEEGMKALATQTTGPITAANLLAMPMQRFMWYSSFAGSVMSLTTKRHPDYPGLEEAVRRYKALQQAVSNSINIAELESSRILLAIADSIELGLGQLLIEPGRYVIKDSSIQADVFPAEAEKPPRSMPRAHLFLMTDLLVLCEKKVAQQPPEGEKPDWAPFALVSGLARSQLAAPELQEREGKQSIVVTSHDGLRYVLTSAHAKMIPDWFKELSAWYTNYST